MVQPVELRVSGSGHHQLCVAPTAGHAATLEVDDPVGVGDGEQVVRDDDGGTAVHQSPKRYEDALGRLGVEPGGRFVE
jgi:hypothetical protein